MSTVYILDVTDAASNVQVRAGFGVLDLSTGTGAGIIAAASLIGELSDTSSKRSTRGEDRAWRAMRTLAGAAADPAIANVVLRAYPPKALKDAGAIPSGIDRAFLRRIGHDIAGNLRDGLARTIDITDGGEVRTIAFVPARAMKKLAALPIGGQEVPASVKRALPKLLAA